MDIVIAKDWRWASAVIVVYRDGLRECKQEVQALPTKG